MPPVDDRTPYRSYQKPNAANTLADDVARLRAALDAIDADIAPYTKVSVLCATTANITLSGTQTIDGISASNGARVLVKNQTLPAENGIYIQNNSGAWTRAADMNTAASAANALVGVQSGTTNGGSIWINTFKSTDTLGTTAMSWLQIGASGVTTFSAGTTGLTPSTATAGAVTLAGTLAVANGGTGVTTSTGTGSVVLSASPTLTGTSTFRGSNSVRAENASTQDAIVLAGRAGGTGSFASTFTPTTLTANRTVTIPDIDGDIVTTKTVSYATAVDLGASTYAAGVLTGYPYNGVASATTTDGSPVISIDTSSIQPGRTVNVASLYVPAGLVISSIDSTTQLTLTSAVRTINITGVTGNGTTATVTYSAQTYAPFAVGSTITVSGTGVVAYDANQVVTACTTTSVQFSSIDTTTVGALGTVSQSITAGTASLSFRNVIGGLNIDGITQTVNTRVLVKDQRTLGGFVVSTASAYNGIYTVTSIGGSTTSWVLTRTSDANTSANLANSRVLVKSGNTNKGKVFYTTFLSTDTIDTSPVIFKGSILSGPGTTTALTTGVGIDIDLSVATIATTTSLASLLQNNIAAKTITAPSAVTHTNAAAFYIGGAPTASTNVTITDPWSLWLGAGNFRNDGTMSIGNMAAARGPILTFGTITGGSGYTDGTYTNILLTGGRGSTATADITVLGGTVTSVVINKEGGYYQVGDILSATSTAGGFGNGTGSGFSIPVATVRSVDIQIYTASPRIRLGTTNSAVSTGTELGSVLFSSSDTSTGARGDKVILKAIAESTLGGGTLQLFTSAASSDETLAVELTGSNVARLYNSTATFYHSFSTGATANRTVTIADENCVINAGIPSGTKMLFQQTSAPTGWTKDLTHDNKALRVVTGTASSGGTSTFTSVFASRTPGGSVANTTLTTAQMPFHQHTYNYKTATQQLNNGSGGLSSPLWTGDTSTAASGSAGSGSSHTHGFTGTAMDFAVQYVDLIIATKN